MTNIVAAIARMQAAQASIPPDSPRRPDPAPERERPAAYRALHSATDGILRQVVEHHAPVDGGTWRWECRGCDADGYEWEPPEWPCGTTQLIARQLGVPLRADHYVVDEP